MTQLPNPPEEDDLVSLTESLKSGLMSLSTGGSMDNTEYIRTRKILLSNPGITDMVPEYIKNSRDLGDFWQYIKMEYPSYAERRRFLSDTLNPLIEQLETGGETLSIIEEKIDGLEQIGNGGFGQVYKYKHKIIDVEFAVKVFAPAFSNGGDGNLERFFREARILFQLNHPNIIKVHDVGMIDRRPYIKMEYFEGKNLNQALQEHGNISMERALVLIDNIVNAIKHAHDVGIVHRDIKPSNIMVARPNKFRVIDFGIGVFIENDLVSRITRTGEGVAGGYFTAPELVQNPRLLSKQTDIYSIGAVWFNVLVGRPPAGSDIRVILLGVNDMTESYANVVMKCLADSRDRYSDCSELITEIQRLKNEIIS